MREVPDPPHLEEAFGDRSLPGSEREGALLLGARAALERHGDHDEHEQEQVDEAHLVEEHELHVGLGDPDDDAGRQCPGERDHASDDRCGECPDHRVGAKVGEARDPATVSGEHDQRDARECAADGPDEEGHQLGVDAGESGQVGVVGRCLHGLAEDRPVEEPGEGDGDQRDDEEDRQLGARDPQAEHVVPGGRDRDREAGAAGDFEVRIGGHDGLHQLGDADGGDQHDHPGRGEQPTDHRPFDEGPDEGADEHCRGQCDPERPLVVDDQEGEQPGGRQAHVADRQVDDFCGPVDEHDAEGEQPEHHPVDESVEPELAGGPDGEHGRL